MLACAPVPQSTVPITLSLSGGWGVCTGAWGRRGGPFCSHSAAVEAQDVVTAGPDLDSPFLDAGTGGAELWKDDGRRVGDHFQQFEVLHLRPAALC